MPEWCAATADPGSAPPNPLQNKTIQEEFRAAHEKDLEMLTCGEQTRNVTLITRAAHRIRGAAGLD